MPLSMLHPAPHGTQRKTRGRVGSLFLFSWGSFLPDYTPVYPDDCAPSRSRLCKTSKLPSRDREGAVTKTNCSALHQIGDKCLCCNRLTLLEFDRFMPGNCLF